MTAIIGFGRRNPHCSNCGDERGGPFGHEISECSSDRRRRGTRPQVGDRDPAGRRHRQPHGVRRFMGDDVD